ncbi:transcription termination/antitermination protein NusA [Dissulfurirhabdus thermomarina]|uniref:Transcription termination/antitermination protein NusA n=1 Tax=Dissulfurirhabdus thermomarina TaxID=1765737 RepID=A0A6N9TUD0_DISTH|nr:transcription termination factor NusA [Dissulfurirhabdus thermomarina]NDY43344.1 transcription termination/antitermination protein NusA [Dissulfurirhabdus thermomarina]NMX23908.1 transcription termination/antitermination protein NusA [Dissulfurirhabdus thermomarina]
MGLELKRIIDQVSKEKGLDREILVSALEEAIKSAVKKRYGARLELEVHYDEATGDLEVFQFRTVVEEVEDDQTEISMEEARELDPDSELGDSIGTAMDISSLGRIAAQSARQVIIQRMKSAERDLIYEEYKGREGEIVNGIIQRYERGNVIVNLGRTEAILPHSEQISSESYRRGDRLKAYILEVRKSTTEPQIVLSRTHPNFLVKLFELEVPEMADGIVRIMGVARDPGSRAKIAVASSDSDVDPVGACVGMRGSRVQAVVQELRGEKIDIVPWNLDPAKYVYNALSPAECSRVIVDDANQALEVIVPDDQLSLAIGRQGQNVRLAARLLGWRIDVKSETRYIHLQDPDYRALLRIPGMTENLADKLYDNDFTSPARLAEADPEELAAALELEPELAAELVEGARNLPPESETDEETGGEEGEEDEAAGAGAAAQAAEEAAPAEAPEEETA